MGLPLKTCLFYIQILSQSSVLQRHSRHSEGLATEHTHTSTVFSTDIRVVIWAVSIKNIFFLDWKTWCEDKNKKKKKETWHKPKIWRMHGPHHTVLSHQYKQFILFVYLCMCTFRPSILEKKKWPIFFNP